MFSASSTIRRERRFRKVQTQILATADHSSHADLCDGPNDGLSHAGLAIGYKF
ncbi:acyloxyacyl hydrolase [Pararhizobium sp. LjRoot238]